MTLPNLRPACATHCRACDVEWVGPAACWNCGEPGEQLIVSSSHPWVSDFARAPGRIEGEEAA